VKETASASTHLRAMLKIREKKPRLLIWRPRVDDDVEIDFSFRMAMVAMDKDAGYLDLHRARWREQSSVCGQSLGSRMKVADGGLVLIPQTSVVLVRRE
jgi:hypothetical protein